MYHLVAAVLLWPFASLIEYIRVLAGIFLPLLPCMCLGVLSFGPKVSKTANMWTCLNGWPGGKYMYSKLVGFFAPYSASIDPLITSVEPGVCEAMMTDRPWKRNPFASVHAIAIANLAEMTAGIACVTAIESTRGVQGIPVDMKLEFVAKARGTLFCRASLPSALPTAQDVKKEKDINIVCDVSDTTGKVVAAVSVLWSFRLKSKQ